MGTRIARGGVTVACLLLLAWPLEALARSSASPPNRVSAAISTSYAERVIRRYINQQYNVALGPDFGSCLTPASSTVRCEVQFKAGLYWRCGRVSVRKRRLRLHLGPTTDRLLSA
jgi:hypothetical protein